MERYRYKVKIKANDKLKTVKKINRINGQSPGYQCLSVRAFQVSKKRETLRQLAIGLLGDSITRSSPHGVLTAVILLKYVYFRQAGKLPQAHPIFKQWSW
jgi:hypothetical protein